MRNIPLPLIENGLLQYVELAPKNMLSIAKQYFMTMRQVIERDCYKVSHCDHHRVLKHKNSLHHSIGPEMELCTKGSDI